MLFNLWILWDQSPLKLSDETLSNLLFLNRHFKKLSKSDKSHKKAEFKAPKMKPMRVIQATPKAKTKIETSSDSEDYEEKDLVDNMSDGSLNLGNSDIETQM